MAASSHSYTPPLQRTHPLRQYRGLPHLGHVLLRQIGEVGSIGGGD